MNYLHVYIQLVRQYKARELPKGYTEEHHYFPVSIFGNNDKTITVTYREHFVLHRLLAKIFEKRYGLSHAYTRKMNQAIHRMVYGTKNQDRINRTSREFEIAKKAMKDAKIGKPRPDMKGKKYFGASEETIKALKQKVSKTRTGMHTNYPKTRKPLSNRTQQVFDKISQSRKKTFLKYQNMSEQEFNQWIEKQKLLTYMKNGKIRLNVNVTRAIAARNETLSKYFKEQDLPENWLSNPKNFKLFYQL